MFARLALLGALVATLALAPLPADGQGRAPAAARRAAAGLLLGSYIGGRGDDELRGIAVGPDGATYVVGFTDSENLPVTSGAAQPALAGAYDAFVAKLSADGSRVVYLTYLGGSGDDVANGVAVDAAGSAYVVGRTDSADFPTTAGAHGRARAGGSADAFVVRLSPDGSSLVYATYLGGVNEDVGSAIALDRDGAAYVTGLTRSPDLPTTVGAAQTSFGGGVCRTGTQARPCADGFVARLSPGGDRLDFATFLGGAGEDRASAVAVDAAGNVYVAGQTTSASFPVTPGAFQGALRGGEISGDAFVVALDSSGRLIYGTYYGGSGDDQANALAVDATGAVCLTGSTMSSDLPTAGPASSLSANGIDGFAARLAPGGGALGYGLYLSAGTGNALALAADGSLLVAGHAAGGDVLIAQVTSGGAVAYSTTFGGSADDDAYGIVIDAAGRPYAVGGTFSSDFPVAGAAVQPAPGGARSVDYWDGFLARLGPVSLVPTPCAGCRRTSLPVVPRGPAP